MKICFLGTNGWYDTETGNTPCTLVDAKDQYLVFDAGNGIHKLDKYTKKKKSIHLFISHLHIDHIVGLHILGKFHFEAPFHLYLPQGTKKHLEIFTNHPFTSPLDKLSYRIEVHELTEGEHQLPFKLTAKKINHVDACYGYRVEVDEKTIAYCADTGLSENAVSLAKNADILIHECAYKEDAPPSSWGHVRPSEAAHVAQKAEAKKLVLIHLSANFYPDFKSRKEAENIAKKTFSNTVAAKDNMVVEI
jgi:ribonuclease BN (tRNA processing enzyme)